MSDSIEQQISRPLAFTGGTLDRADQVRVHDDKLAAAWAHPNARVLVLDGLDPMPDDQGQLVTSPLPKDAQLRDHALLGVHEDGAPLFVSLIKTQPSEEPTIPPRVWSIIPLLAPDQAALYAGARSVADWHHRHPHCSVCGGKTEAAKAGWSRKCVSCGSEHFPRTDPVVIMLAEYEGKVLVGRSPRFPPRRFSALAGFIEPGETIEEAVRRELWEEAGIRVGRVDYLMSQPWPFPSNLMIACMAQALDDELTLDVEEIAEAIWVSRDDVRRAFAEEEDALFQVPTPIAVAHHMLKMWVEAPERD
jgi:NAD+ diphosphatase